MPKERIHHGVIWAHKKLQDTEDIGWGGIEETKPYDPERDSGDYDRLEEDPSLDVTWMRDAGHVQVSIEFPREQWLKIVKSLEENPDQIKEAIYTPNLSRHELNEMIRVLRRARDQAYGKDE